MANPQKENGYTAIANELLEALCRRTIRGEARAVFDAILRKTYGFQKKADKLPISQLSKLTGLPASEVCRSLRYLRNHKIIIRNETGTTNIQKDYEKWLLAIRPVAIRPVARLPTVIGKVANTATGKVATLKRKRQKKLSKENIAKAMQPKAATSSAEGLKSSKPTEPMNQDIDRSFPRKRLYGDEALNYVLDYWEHKMPNPFIENDKWAKIYAVHLKNKIGLGKVRDIIDWASDPDCWWFSRLSGFKMLYYKRDQILRSMAEPPKLNKNKALNLNEIV